MTKETYQGIFIFIAIFITGFIIFSHPEIIGFWDSTFAFILGSLGGILGFFIGD